MSETGRPQFEDAIAERTFEFVHADSAVEAVTVRVGRPTQAGDAPDEWRCSYQIVGPHRTKSHWMIGVDSLQALLLTVQILTDELNAMARETGGHFR